MQSKNPRDKWSYRTHLVGAFLALAATIYLVGRHLTHFGPFLIFGLSAIALYGCSALYHYMPGPPERILKLRKLDHCMIFVLIAGTYTPVILAFFTGTKALVFLLVMWGVTLLGSMMKLVFMKAPRWLYTLLYLIMGWAAVGEIPYFFGLSPGFVFWLVAGGVSYSIGAVMYALKKPNPSPEFGFHELFHVFIIIGTACHFVAISFYLP